MDWLYDARTQCWSVQTTMSVGAYLQLVEDAHQAQGAISGQRDVLTTTTAKRIRARMIADIQQGAVLPPVVIGARIEEGTFGAISPSETTDVEQLLDAHSRATLSVIDGMQRTAALMEAARIDVTVRDRHLRVEFWLATNVRAMVYRMLVLNTGQVPWTMTRQLAVVFAPLLDEVRANVPELEKMPSVDNPGRRVGPAQYSSDAVVELYIAFSLRKTAVDTKEAVSDEFSRLDFVENVADPGFQDQFYRTLSMMARLDKVFSKYEGGQQGRFQRGRAVFDAQPARIGYVVAIGTTVLGRPGANRPPDERDGRLVQLEQSVDLLISRLEALENDQLGDYLRLDVLQEVLDRRVGQVGRYERAVFADAFKVLVEEEFALENLEPCWRAN